MRQTGWHWNQPWLCMEDFTELLYAWEKEGGEDRCPKWKRFSRHYRMWVFTIWASRGHPILGLIVELEYSVLWRGSTKLFGMLI